MEQYKVTSNAGKFYIGDLCYQMLDNVYDKVWGDEHDYEDGCFDVNGSYFDSNQDSMFAVHSTAFGDGSYSSNSGTYYPVDGGNLGVVPVELFKLGVEEADLGSIHEGHEMVMEVDENYTFTFYLDGKLIEQIYTGDEEDEEEDGWYDEDEENYDDEDYDC